MQILTDVAEKFGPAALVADDGLTLRHVLQGGRVEARPLPVDVETHPVDDVAEHLLSDPVPLTVVGGPEVDGGAPAAPGLYAWWAPAGALPGIAGPPHPRVHLELLYVGIAPNGTTSKSTLRSRLVSDHVRGRTGSSTLRRALAALLSENQGWRSRWTTRPVLVDDDELRLSRWMQDSLQVTWTVHPEPWTVESAVIRRLEPPLNQDDNHDHPLYGYVKQARSRWRETAAAASRGEWA